MRFTRRTRAGTGRSRLGVALVVLGVAGGPSVVLGQTGRWTGVQPGPDLDDRVRAMVEGPEGRLWMGVESGLRVFDGYTVEVFRAGPGSVSGFPTAPVESLYLDREERLWVGQRGLLVEIDPRRGTVEAVHRHDPRDPSSLPAGFVSHLVEDPDGRFWVGVLDWSGRQESGLALLDRATGGVRRFVHDPDDPTSLSNNRIRSIVSGPDGDLWVATWSGLNRLPRGGSAFTRYLHDPDDPSSLAYDDVMALHVDDDGRLWVATIGGGLDRYDPGRDGFDHVPGMPSPMLTAITGFEDGALWVGTLDGGLARYDPVSGAVDALELSTGTTDWPRVNATLVTSDGTLWIAATRSPGEDAGVVLRYDMLAPEVAFRSTAGRVRAIHGTDPEVLWYGDGSRLVRWDSADGTESRFTCPGLPPPSPLQWLSSLVPGSDGVLWVGYWGDTAGALCRLNPDDPEGPRLEPLDLSAGGEGPRVWDMAWADDRLWLATAVGVRSYDPTSETFSVEVTGEESVWDQPASVVALETDPSGRLWMARQDGRISRRTERGAFDEVGAVFGDDLEGRVASLRFDGAGRLLVGTEGRGLCVLGPDAGLCEAWLDAGRGLPSDFVEDVVADARGHLWVTTFTGLTEVDPDSGAVRTLRAPGRVDLGGFQPGGVWAAPDGRALAMGLERGVLSFDPNGARGNTRPPRVRIDRVEAVGAGDLDLGGETHALESERRDLVFEYVGLHYSDPSANTFSYRLDGQDDAWRFVGAERRARYTNLAPGSYRFRVRAASANGVWSDEADFGFRILAPWWRRPWALALWVTLATATLAGVRAVESRRRRFRTVLEQRQAEALRLRELADARSRLFANLSHEYRTPLALILGQIESARARQPGDADDRLAMAERQTRTLQRLTDELLELSRFEAGALVLDRRTGDLTELVRAAAADFASAAQAAGVALRVEADSESILTRFDPERMRRVVSNLLSNALKFTPAGGEVVARVARNGSAEGPTVDLSVEDTGVGIPDEARAHVFDRFYQVRAAPGSSAGGTGIGLALVRELVELHGGTITVDPTRTVGTRFVVRLPMDEAVALRPTEPAEESPGDDRPIVLVVEDHDDTRAFLRQELAGDYHVEVARDGESGLTRAIELVPDVVITDVGLPGMDGYEMVRRLRSDERTSHVPIVMLTGRVSDDARVEGLESGVDDYLGKPFSAKVLRSRLRSLLDLRRLLRDRYAGETWLRPEEVEGTSLDRAFLESVTAVIEARIGDSSLSVEELASAVAMSRSQLHRKLTALVGQAPGTLIRGMRLRRAADLIQSGSHSLGRIAYETGFSDQAHFTRSFKRQFGCTPGEFRDRPGETG